MNKSLSTQQMALSRALVFKCTCCHDNAIRKPRFCQKELFRRFSFSKEYEYILNLIHIQLSYRRRPPNEQHQVVIFLSDWFFQYFPSRLILAGRWLTWRIFKAFFCPLNQQVFHVLFVLGIFKIERKMKSSFMTGYLFAFLLHLSSYDFGKLVCYDIHICCLPGVLNYCSRKAVYLA